MVRQFDGAGCSEALERLAGEFDVDREVLSRDLDGLQELRALDSGGYLRGKHDEPFDAKLVDCRPRSAAGCGTA